MKVEEIANGSESVSVTIWDEVSEPVGVVQILHGMAEHIGRYAHFAEFLNANRYIVAGSDHRGHGSSALGMYGRYDGDSAEQSLSDSMAVSKMLKSRYGLPLIVFGHSYGSFLTQDYILRKPMGADAFILSGSGYMGGLLAKFGRFVAGRKVKRGKGDEAGNFFAKMSFVSYDKRLGEGKNAWLSRDKDEVEKYNHDNACGFTCSNRFYKNMFDLFIRISDMRRLNNVGKNLHICLISGACDPVGGNGKLVVKLRDMYQNAGVDVKFKLYQNCRHELLNELDKEQVNLEILAYLNTITHHDNA